MLWAKAQVTPTPTCGDGADDFGNDDDDENHHHHHL